MSNTVTLDATQIAKLRRFTEAVRAFDVGEPSDVLDRANFGYYFEGKPAAVNILGLLDRIDALTNALGDMMNEHTPLGQHENGEIEYCSLPACRKAYDTLHPNPQNAQNSPTPTEGGAK